MYQAFASFEQLWTIFIAHKSNHHWYKFDHEVFIIATLLVFIFVDNLILVKLTSEILENWSRDCKRQQTFTKKIFCS